MFERAKLRNYWFEFRFFFALDSPFIEEGYRLYNITLRPTGAEQRVKPLAKAIHYNHLPITIGSLCLLGGTAGSRRAVALRARA